MIRIFFFLFFCGLINPAQAKYISPGTGVKWSLDDLVINSSGNVTFAAGEYNVNDTLIISTNDTLYILSDVVVKFASVAYLGINGVLTIDPPTGVLFTPMNTGFLGIRLDFSVGSVLRKLTLEYANSLRLFDCSPIIDQCVFQYNTPNTTFGNAAISLFRANPLITNTQFLNNMRAAIQGGSNIANAPKIISCIFRGNNTSNQNVPQINLGATSASGTDTVKIINNQILQASTNSGGIGFLPIGNVYAIISGNTIKKNRYGITLNGGSNINALISYNVIDSNNTQGNPLLGGSGIAFTGGSATSHQNSIVTGNSFRANLWGITIQNGSKPNLGNTMNADTSDDGKNIFIENTNATTPDTDLYNNSPDPITAHNNNWNTSNPAIIESHIFHQPDNPALGLVDFTGFIVIPVELISFTATRFAADVLLTWKTASEFNSDFFSIERSYDGVRFEAIGRVRGSGTSQIEQAYRFTDSDVRSGPVIYYRLQLVDKDGSFRMSPIARITTTNERSIKYYPTIVHDGVPIQLEITSDIHEKVLISFYSADGKLVHRENVEIIKGYNSIRLAIPPQVSSGQLIINITGRSSYKPIIIIKN